MKPTCLGSYFLRGVWPAADGDRLIRMNDPAARLDLKPDAPVDDSDRKSIHLGLPGRTPPFTEQGAPGFLDRFDRRIFRSV